MGTTVVVRGEEWLPSYPLHVEIFNALGFKQPKYIHTPLIYKFNEKGNKIKISKRKHPEADMRFFDKEGYDKEAVIEYLTNLINSNFEIWRAKIQQQILWNFLLTALKLLRTHQFLTL